MVDTELSQPEDVSISGDGRHVVVADTGLDLPDIKLASPQAAHLSLFFYWNISSVALPWGT